MNSQDWSRRVRGAEAFAGAYDGPAPWDTGHPQAAIVAAADAGLVTGRVLDVGCGTGEHALLAATRGLPAIGLDVVPRAIDLARAKAAARGLYATFAVGDACDLPALEVTVDTVIDVGLFHVLDDLDRAAYVEGLREVVAPGGRVLLLCFSDQVPGDAGPRRVAKQTIHEAFADGFTVESIDDSTIEVAFGPVDAVHAWLAIIARS